MNRRKILSATFLALLAAAVLICPLFIGGCVSQTGQPQAITDQDVHDGVQFAVATYVLTGGNDGNARADRVRDIATQVITAADTNIDVTNLREMAVNLILKQSDESSRAAANVLVNAIISQVRRRMGVSLDVVTLPPEQFTEARRLIKLAAQSALESVAMVQKK